MTKTKYSVGNIRNNRHGTPMLIIEYNNYRNIVVEFQDEYKFTKRTWCSNFKNGRVKNPYDKTIFKIGYIGVGPHICVKDKEKNKAYSLWASMIQRCYIHTGKNKFPAYIGCSVVPEWHNFQNFAEWYNKNCYSIGSENLTIDKDILVKGNKVYGPNTCCLVPERINLMFVSKKNIDNGLPIGVHFDSERNKYMACCGINVSGSRANKKLGRFKTPEEAFKAYKTEKEIIIKRTAEEYRSVIPDKVYQALINYVVEETD